MLAAPLVSSVRPPRSGTFPISTDLTLAAGRAVSGVDTGPMISTKSSASHSDVSGRACSGAVQQRTRGEGPVGGHTNGGAAERQVSR